MFLLVFDESIGIFFGVSKQPTIFVPASVVPINVGHRPKAALVSAPRVKSSIRIIGRALVCFLSLIEIKRFGSFLDHRDDIFD